MNIYTDSQEYIYVSSKLGLCWREYNKLLRGKILYTYVHCAKLYAIKLVQTTKTRRKPHCRGRKFKLLNIFRRKTFRTCLTQNCHEYFILYPYYTYPVPLTRFVSFNSHGRKFKCCLQEMLMVSFEFKKLLHCSSIYRYCSICIHIHVHIKYKTYKRIIVF